MLLAILIQFRYESPHRVIVLGSKSRIPVN